MKKETTALYHWLILWNLLILAASAEAPAAKLRYIMYLTGYGSSILSLRCTEHM